MAEVVRYPNSPFSLYMPFPPAGDQPQAIEKLCAGLEAGVACQTLLGVTGSGKTYTMANVIARAGVPAIILAPNKTLAAQTYSEMREFFPENAVEYFVSYYDFYQPEAYVPARDLFIEKDAAVNEHIEQMRLAATKSILERRDTIIVATVSSIYGIGAPESYTEMRCILRRGDARTQRQLISQLVRMQYRRTDTEFVRGTFRVRGDTIDVFPAEHAESAVRVELFDDEIDAILLFDPLTGRIEQKVNRFVVYPASHYVTPREEILRAIESIKVELKERRAELLEEGKLLEAQRLEERTRFDLEMLDQVGFCKGIENYSRHLTGLAPGVAPPCLIDYLPADAIMFFDESHVMMGQLGGMYRGDYNRKSTLADYGFRLPSCVDNRPLKFDEWNAMRGQTIFVSATPGDWELEQSGGSFVEQVIRPTGLADPVCVVRPVENQIDDLMEECRKVIAKGERVLVTTLTKKMAEDLTEYLNENGIKVRYLHSDIDTMERIEIIRDLRLGVFDVLVGINLLREGLDIPECSLVAILDADKEGFLRSTRSLIQTIGRAARNAEGKVILYADKITGSIKQALDETQRRREKQMKYNAENGITPKTIKKSISATLKEMTETDFVKDDTKDIEEIKNVEKKIKEYTKLMKEAAANLEFETAVIYRDKIKELELLAMKNL